jgi:hypothetical protein
VLLRNGRPATNDYSHRMASPTCQLPSRAAVETRAPRPLHLLPARARARRQVFLTPTHLCIVMEYAAGGELFDHIVKAGRFSEDEARYFFQQLICGVDYCHRSVRAGGGAAGRRGRRRGRSKRGGSGAAASSSTNSLVPTIVHATDMHTHTCTCTCTHARTHARTQHTTPPGRVPPGPQAGEHAARRQRGAAAEDLRLWLQQERAGQPAQEHRRDAGVHRARGERAGGAGRGNGGAVEAAGGRGGGGGAARLLRPCSGARRRQSLGRRSEGEQTAHKGGKGPAALVRGGAATAGAVTLAGAGDAQPLSVAPPPGPWPSPPRCCSARRTTATRRTCGAAA